MASLRPDNDDCSVVGCQGQGGSDGAWLLVTWQEEHGTINNIIANRTRQSISGSVYEARSES